MILCDSGPLIAVAVRDDAHYNECTALITGLRLATLDQRHFRVVRPSHVDALTLLPEVR